MGESVCPFLVWYQHYLFLSCGLIQRRILIQPDRVEDPDQTTDEDHEAPIPTGFCQRYYRNQQQVNENEYE